MKNISKKLIFNMEYTNIPFFNFPLVWTNHESTLI